MPVLEQRDAEVVGRIARDRLRALERPQHADRIGGPAHREQDVRAQQLDVVADVLGHLAADVIERVERVGGVVLLELDPREAVGRGVAHRVLHVGLEHGLHRAAGAVIHAIVELERADREFRGLDVVLERVERGLVDSIVADQLGVDALERL